MKSRDCEGEENFNCRFIVIICGTNRVGDPGLALIGLQTNGEMNTNNTKSLSIYNDRTSIDAHKLVW